MIPLVTVITAHHERAIIAPSTNAVELVILSRLRTCKKKDKKKRGAGEQFKILVVDPPYLYTT
jgi:hypothetical protein